MEIASPPPIIMLCATLIHSDTYVIHEGYLLSLHPADKPIVIPRSRGLLLSGFVMVGNAFLDTVGGRF